MPLVETAVWILAKDCRAQPRNGTQICTGKRNKRTGGLLKVSRFDTGPRQPEHKVEMAEVNPWSAAELEKA
jgi:hypothetical protein